MHIMMSHIPFYLQLRIEAYDQGTPPKTNTTVAIVSVTRNFYEPAFNSTSYNVRIPETKPLGDVIITIIQSQNFCCRIKYVYKHSKVFKPLLGQKIFTFYKHV
jgi:hypothetical protein